MKSSMRDSLRILIGADTFAPNVNGAARFAERLAEGMAGRGHDVHVLAPSPDGREFTEDFHGATVHRVRSRKTFAHPDFRISLPWDAKRRARQVLAAVDPDVVHTQAHFLVGRGLVGAATRSGTPLIATNHFMPENLVGYVHLPQWVNRVASRQAWRDLARVYGKADTVTAPTPRAVKLLHDNGFPGEVRPISCGIDVGRYGGNGVSVPGTILFVGRLDAEKRINELLRAAATMTDWLPVNVEIVGDGACRAELEELAARLGISHRVRFHGHVSDTELLAAYARAEVFCMPGVAELQSLATLEAMSASKPVVAANAVALPHLVRDGHNGWLYTPGDIDGLAERLRRVLGSPDAGAKMGRASRQLVAAHDIENTLDEFEGLYRHHAQVPARRLLHVA
jgi:glycosyltransferase involved in cell wall biosynthesis